MSHAHALREAVRSASRGLVEREALVELIVLATVAREHLLVIGPPGTAKSAAVRAVAEVLGCRYFEYLLGRFTEPAELFGPVDLRRLRDGVVETATAGMLPEAEVAFLDEVFLGSTAILNTLLGLLNERTFRRGHTQMRCPLRICVGAANHVPEHEELAAFADRFLLHVYVEPLADAHLEDLLDAGWFGRGRAPATSAALADLDGVSLAADAVDLQPLRPQLAHALRRLRHAGITLTDRRMVKTQSLIAAAAALAGRRVAEAADLWPLVYAVPSAEGQAQARDALGDLLQASANTTLPAAADEAAASPQARAERLADRARAVLAQPGADRAAWQLHLEGLLRECDAGFATPPEPLAAIRAQLVAALQ